MLVGFVFVVYWDGNDGETFQQSFSLLGETGNILDQSPETTCILDPGIENLGVAYFDCTFRYAGTYFIKVYQDGTCIETVPVDAIRAGSNNSELLQ